MSITTRANKGTALSYTEMDQNFEAIAPRTSETGQLALPVGSTAQRDTDLSLGQIRFNTDINELELYNGAVWTNVISSGGGGSGANITGPFSATGEVNFYDTTGSTSTTTGAVIIGGGVGIAENVFVGGDLDVAGNINIGGTITLGDNSTDVVSIRGEIDSNLTPIVDNLYELGSASKRWRVSYTTRLEATIVETSDLNATNVTTTNLVTSTIDSADSSEIQIEPAVRVASDLSVENDLTVTNKITANDATFNNNVDITGDVDINGGLTVGPVTFPDTVGEKNYVLTSTGTGDWTYLPPDTFASNRIYVSKEGNDNNDGITGAVATIKKGVQLAAELVYTPANPVTTREDQGDLLLRNKNFIAAEVIEYLTVTYPTLTYNQDKCYRDTIEIIESAVYDMRFTGNSRSVQAGKFYYEGTTGSLLIPSNQRAETADGITYAKTLALQVFKNQTVATVRSTETQIIDNSISTDVANDALLEAGFDIVTDILTNGLGSAPAVVDADFLINNITVMVSSGDYEENNPIILPDNVSIVGDNLRRAVLRPLNANKDMFKVRNSSYMTGIVFRDRLSGITPNTTFRYAIAFDDVLDTSVGRTGYVNLPASRPKIFTSPYIQNCSVISFLGGNGVEIDGTLIDTPNTPPTNIEAENPVDSNDGIPEQGKSMVANAFTILSFGGNAWRVLNDAYAQIVSCFVIFTENGCLTQNGGYLSITNSASNFGLFALRSTGYSPNSFEFDRGVVFGNGVSESFQTIKVAGLQRPALEHFILRFRSGGSDITNNYNNDSTFGVTASLTPTTVNVTNTQITFPAAHGFSSGDVVEYDANGNVEIVGLLNECTYFVNVVNSTTISLFHDSANTKPVRNLDASVTSGTHNFKTGYEEFYINEIISSHSIYQEITVPNATYTFNVGDTITATDGGDTISAVITNYDSDNNVFTVSVELVQVGQSQVRNLFTTSSVIDAGEIRAGTTAVSAVNNISNLHTSEFTVISTYNRSLQNIANTTNNDLYLHRPSICNSSAHTWEYAGSGTDYNALPQNGGQTDEDFEQVSTLPGRVYTSGTNELGDFKVGNFVKAFNRTGNIEFVNQVSIGQLDSLALSLSSGVEVNEISTDIELGDNEVGGATNSRLVTQLAARSFLNNRLGNFIDQNLSSNAIPNAVVQLNSQGQINSDLIPPQGNFTSYTVNEYEGRFDLHNDIPVNDLKAGDIAVERYDQTSLTLSGNVTVVKDETITQANSGATGIVKDAVTNSNDIKLIEPLQGTFTTNAADTLTGSTSGALGVYPTIVTGPTEITDNYFITTSRDSQYLVTDPTESYTFTSIISNNTQVQGAVSGAIATVDEYRTGVLTAIDIVNDIPGGSGYSTPGSYTDIDVQNVSGSGSGAKADIVVAGGQITSFDLKRGGSGYTDADVLTVNDADVGGRSGGTAIEVNVTEVENRLYITLNQDAGLEFSANSSNLDFIIDDNVTSQTITNPANDTTKQFDAADTGAGGDVDYATNRITLVLHGLTNGDPLVYDSGANTIIGGTTNQQTYFAKVIDANTIEIYVEYNLSTLVEFSSSSTGTHTLTIEDVNDGVNRFYIAGHGFTTGEAVKISGADLPEPLDNNDFLFVGGVTTNSFTVHQSRGSALDSVNGLIVSAVNLTDRGTGAVTFQYQNVTIVGDANTSGKDTDNWSSLSNVTIDADNIISGIIDSSRLGTGSANNKTFLRGDGSYEFATQGLTNSTVNDPITLTGDSYTDGADTVFYNRVDIRVEKATTTTLGVASFDTNHFEIDVNGKVTTKASTAGGVIDADTVDGLQASAFIRSDSDDTASGNITLSSTTDSTNTTSGALVVSGGVGIAENVHIGGDTVIAGDLTVNGTTVTVNSSTVTIDDPIFTLGGDTAPVADDNKDRGIHFRWFDSGALTPSAKQGFFGFDDSTGNFIFVPDATLTSEEVTAGAYGTVQAGAYLGDSLTSDTADTDLTLVGNGTGIVLIDDNSRVSGTFEVDSTSQFDAKITVTAGGIDVQAGGINSNSISSYDANTNLTLSADGTGFINLNDETRVSQTLKLNNADSLSFESDKHWITYNDGLGNFNIRVGHYANASNVEEITEAGYAFHEEWTQSNGNKRFNVTNASLAVGNTIDGVTNTWRTQLHLKPDVVTIAYEGSPRLTTDSSGITVYDNIQSGTSNTDLTLSANGTGTVYVDDNFKISGSLIRGTGTITIPDNTSGTMIINVSDTTTTTQGALNLDFSISAAGQLSATGTAQNLSATSSVNFNSITSGSANTDLTLAANGTGAVYVNDTLKLSGNITKGTGTITVPNNTSGTMVISAGTSATQSGLDLSIDANGQITGSAEGLATSDSPEFTNLVLDRGNSAAGPLLTLANSRTNQADGDISGTIRFQGLNSADLGLVTLSKIESVYLDYTPDSSRDSELNFYTTIDQIETEVLSLNNEVRVKNSIDLSIEGGDFRLDSGDIIYEGTADTFQTTINFVDPTAARTINVPNNSGTFAVTGSTTTTTTQGEFNTSVSIDAAGAIGVGGSADGLATSDSPTFSGLTLSSLTSALPVFRMENGNSDGLGPVIEIGKTTTLESDGDDLGKINFFGKDSGNVERTYAQLLVESNDITETTKDSSFNFSTYTNNTFATNFRIGYLSYGTYTSGISYHAGNVQLSTGSELYKDPASTNNTTMIRLHGNDNSTTIIRASRGDQGDADQGEYGFSLKYRGDLSGNSNRLELFADNQQAASQVSSWYINQDGLMHIQQGLRGPGNVVSDNGINIGATADRFNTMYATVFNGTATEAQYADVAEKYLCDAEYETGTVLSVGGDKELTASHTGNAHSVLGVVSEHPALIMNNDLEGGMAVALKGRVPVRVTGKVNKGDRLAPSDIPGLAQANNDRAAWSFAIALEDGDNIVEAVIL